MRVELVDVDPNMLEVAASGVPLTPAGARCDVRFEDELPRCHAVVASLALHHVATHDEKRELYAASSERSSPAASSPSPTLSCIPKGPSATGWSRICTRTWAERHLGEGAEHFASWGEEDFYVPLPDELGLIAAAGFPHPDCFWREG